jgi:hypothetical protein
MGKAEEQKSRSWLIVFMMQLIIARDSTKITGYPCVSVAKKLRELHVSNDVYGEKPIQPTKRIKPIQLAWPSALSYTVRVQKKGSLLSLGLKMAM